jgi:pectin methylesterase-like acyl-CoA thioesterase
MNIMTKCIIIKGKLTAWCCIGLLFSPVFANAQNIFVQFPTSGGAGTATIAAPAGNSSSAAAPVAGTSWNTFGESSIVLPSGTAAGTYTFYNNSALVNSVGTSIAETLTITETCPVTLTHANPSTGSGENTIQAGGVMKGAWRNYNNSSGFFITYTFANLPASTPYGIYVYGGTTTSGQGVAINLTNSASWLGANPITNLVTLNTNANSASSYGSIWTVSGGTTNLMPNLPVGSTATGTQTNGGAWGVLYGQSDSSGNLIFRLGTPAPTGTGSGAYINGFQLVPLSAPSLTGPTDQTVTAGNSTTLSATAGGLPAPTFQWQLTNGVSGFTNIPGATSSSLPLNNVQYAQNGYVYSLIASNILGAVTNNMTLTVIVTPSITGLPASYATNTGYDVTFSPSVAGVPTPTLQWQLNSTNLSDGPTGNGSTISGSTNSTFTITNAQSADSGVYSLIASNSAGIVTNSMTLTVSPGSVPPNITGPTDQTVVQTSNATFTASVSGLPAPDLQWRENGTDIAGATSSSLTLTNVQYSQNGFAYSLVASNSAGRATNSANLYVLVPPTISVQPTNLVVINTQSAAFSVIAAGVPSVAYQWYINSSPIASANSSTYTIASASPTNIGNYSVIITNSVGSVTSSVATLTVNSTMALTALSPTNGATGVCYDTPLYITFSSPPVIGSTSQIRIYNVTNSATPVDTLDMSANITLVSGTNIRSNVQSRTIGGDTYYSYPIIVNGSTAAIYPHAGVMNSNQTYYVTIGDGVFADGSGAYFAGITDTNAWQFTTKPAGPVNPTSLVVAADGSGDFVTVQGAIDSVPANNTVPTTINIRNGVYTEIVDIKSKNNLTFVGQDRHQTLITYANNSALNPVSTQYRVLLDAQGNDIAFENLTLTNSTPHGGSQAEALRVRGLRCILLNIDLDSFQDTLLVNSSGDQAYFKNSHIQGDTDYTWGSGTVYFTNCNMMAMNNGYNCQPRTAQGVNGFAWVNCVINGVSGVNNQYLARDGGNYGQAVYISCAMNTNVIPAVGWVLQNGSDTSTLRFWEYQSTDLTGTNLIDVSQRVSWSLQLNASQAAAIVNVTNWFGGWQPQLSPNIIGQPGNAVVSHGQSTNFSVSATGIPDPTYQWYQNGLPIANATGANYSIASAVRTNGGNYTVVVSNGSGSVTSVVATLTYADTAPVSSPSTYSRPAGYPLVITIAGNLATNWSDADADPLALTNGISSTNGAAVGYDSSYVYYTNANDVADQINYTVGDGQGGTAPGLINVLVGPPPTNSVAGTVLNGDGTVTLNFVGVADYTYQVDATTNLAPPVVWTTVSTNTADIIDGTWQFTDTQATNYPNRFYRSAYRP